MDSDSIPVRPPTRIETEELIRYLTELHAQGHGVSRDAVQAEVFYIQLDDTHRIRISASGGRSQVQLQYLGNVQRFLDVTTLQDLVEAVGELAQRVPGVAWPSRPTAARLTSNTPAKNYATISKLIGSAHVEAVFDPYLTNGALEELTTILSFGAGTITDGVRLLGSAETTTGNAPRFTKRGVDAWLQQLAISGQARVVAASSEHRRFLLLSGGLSLLLGPSLNAIHKNEAIRLEDATEDRPFFDRTWTTATPLP